MASRARIALFSLAVAMVPLTLPGAAPASKPDPRVELARKVPGAKPEDLRAAPIPGVYELTRGADIAYVSADGRYAIAGDLYDIATNENLTEQRRRGARLKLLGTVPESDMLVFSPQAPKYTVTVFTDVDCGYCRKLHSQMSEYNRLGIRVRYLFYPRSGPGTDSWQTADDIWCSSNRNDALTRAKRGETLPHVKQCNSPVARHYALGRDFAIGGTPALLLETGELMPGYLPPSVLAQQLRGK